MDIASVPPLPLYRFLRAEQHGCSLLISYESGGRASGRDVAKLIFDGASWRLTNEMTYHAPRR
ncbi:hypothetical protein [Methylosinus sp. LW4]|uniref:hypothetical protein n=1 Tax=Methylosinus sp. LW4 TaxID=136993 RepID=UPI00037B4D71|nr:hypothetical protein [Methylosinus sp. LW4]